MSMPLSHFVPASPSPYTLEECVIYIAQLGGISQVVTFELRFEWKGSSFLLLLKQVTANLMAYSNTDLFLLQFCRKQICTGLTEPKSGCPQGCIPFWNL